ncbi:MAG: UDP-N-acetyl-D-galactosamine dehydrogenase [Rickettsiales bacterium]|nr:UDP-N-acetyl-D-galactosamine dehydrogenase [Rickettsiales bacterium]OUW72680.1 MAG: hypothetical protein CBD71_00995 [Rickettsiales bacterium TMED211]
MKINKIAIIGLGYVGLPLAVSLCKSFKVLGFDINKKRIRELRSGKDSTNEVSSVNLKMSMNSNLEITSEEDDLFDCNIYIITVPTPVTKANKPDFSYLRKSCKMIGSRMKKHSIIIFESTVYPGATQDICGKEIEKASGMIMEKDFFLGYSPERINPGDKVHTVEKITKVIASENPEVTKVMKKIYSKLTSGNIFIAKNIKVAEASKVIENSQRDINIAFINEITKISQKLDISIFDVLEASETKWNFLPFYPGLVGGHCIGVDPFYLASKAKELGIKPQVILSGRKTNDYMSKFIFSEINTRIKKSSNILILGLTFKEDVPDTRNSKVFDLIKYFKGARHKVDVCDYLVDPEQAQTVNLVEYKKITKHKYDAIILTVLHRDYKKIKIKDLKNLLKKNGLIADLKGFWRKDIVYNNYWSL